MKKNQYIGLLVFAASVIGLLLLSRPSHAASVNLAWDAVTTNSDGSSFANPSSPTADELAGYQIFSANKSMLGMTIQQVLSDSSITKTTIAANQTTATLTLAPGVYYFRLNAFDQSGNQSPLNTDASGAAVQATTLDVNKDGGVTVTDVQSCVNQVLGVATCGAADVNLDGSCTVNDVQLVVNKALGL